MNSVNRDKSAEIHYCHPGAKTKLFTLVQQDGLEFRLDPGGNAKAAELVRKTGKVSYLGVNITGRMSGTTIQVDSITAAPRGYDQRDARWFGGTASARAVAAQAVPAQEIH